MSTFERKPKGPKRLTTFNKSPAVNHDVASIDLIMVEKEIREAEERLSQLVERRERLREEAKTRTGANLPCYFC